jgi:hypothetical protein
MQMEETNRQNYRSGQKSFQRLSDFGNGIKNIYYQLRSKRGAPGKGNEADRQ